MFKIDIKNNRIALLPTKSFSDLGFKERQHLQEWIAHAPQALGEELLIIQKEFDGFDETRERLDLLALDKDGNLVIIENKLDDSGRDVVWQALKYAGYCANLSKSEVVEIYQRYLCLYDSLDGDAPPNAAERIAEFMEAEDFDEVILNRGQSQRIVFVAASYRKEVTNTALWLIGHGIPCQCFKATPYVSSEELFLNFEQVIPTPEAADYMIGFAKKEAEEKHAEKKVQNSKNIRAAFWEQCFQAFDQSNCDMFNNRKPTKANWINTGSGVIGGMVYTLVFNKKEIRVEFNMETSDAQLNEFVYKQLHSQRESIEDGFGDTLVWEPPPPSRLDRRAWRLKYNKIVDSYDESQWADVNQWMIEHIAKFKKVLNQPLEAIHQQIKKAGM